KDCQMQDSTRFSFADQKFRPIVIPQWRHFFDGSNPIIRGFNVLEATPCARLLGLGSFFVDANKKLTAGSIGECRNRLGKISRLRLDSLQINVVTFFNLKNAISFRTAYLALVNVLRHDATLVRRKTPAKAM